MRHVLTLLLALFGFRAIAATYSGCPPDGPLLPRPTNLADSDILKNATNLLQETLHQALGGSIRAGFSVDNTSFSLGLVSYDGPYGHSLWEYHHRGSSNVNGTGTVDGDTQYLVGSISKLISDLLFLRTGIDFETPITQYIPALANESSIILWENITLASLADHLSGIPPNSGFSEWFFLQPLLEQLGFPPLTPDDYEQCNVEGLNRPCTPEEFFEVLTRAHPVTVPYQRPVYSQLSFTLFSYALKAHLNKTYDELLQEHVIQPFGLTNTGASPGNSSRAVIPPIKNNWGSDYGDNAPGGGLYSSLNDLNRIIHSILAKTALGTETEVRQWLKPHAATSLPYTLVGRPWEIYRATNLTPNHPHTIDIYSKNGGAYGYTAQMAVIDQYGIGLSVLTAGPANAYRILYDAMLSVFLSAVEEEAREQAQKYIGNFTTQDHLVTMDTSMDDGPGIKLDAIIRNGSDILGAISQFYSQALPQFGVLSTNFRIFPAEVEEDGVFDKEGKEFDVIREDWRIGLDFLPNTPASAGSDLPGQGAWQGFCSAWQTGDWFYYGGQAVDRIVFLKDKDGGKVLGVEIPFLRATLTLGDADGNMR